MPGFLKKLGLGSTEVSEGIAVDEIHSSGNSSPRGEPNEKDIGVSSAHELSEEEAARRLKGTLYSSVDDRSGLTECTSVQEKCRRTLGPQPRE